MMPLPWAFWQMTVRELTLPAVTSRIVSHGHGEERACGVERICTDMKVIGLMLMDNHWSADLQAWLKWHVILARHLAGPWLRSLVIAHWTWKSTCHLGRLGSDPCAHAAAMTWQYTKLSLLIAHIEGSICHNDIKCDISIVEDFARAAPEQWLKIAGGKKGQVVISAAAGCAASLLGCGCENGTIMLEFGAFVGYTSCRLASHGIVVSFEHDPVHVRVAQHFINLLAPPCTAEVWCGRVSDLIPRVAEARGQGAVALAFLDESGATFHADVARTAAAALPAPLARVVADNCLRPGAPIFLTHWHSMIASAFAGSRLVIWSVPEFLEEDAGVEDWMAVVSM